MSHVTEGFVLENSSCLKIQRFERNLLHHLFLFVIIYLLQLGKLFTADFLYLWISFLREDCASGTRVSRLSAAKAELLFDASFAFSWGEFEDFNGVYDHGVRVMGLGGRGVGEGVIRLVGGFRIPPGYVISLLPLGLEGNDLLVSIIYGGRDGVHGHDVVHQQRGNSCREVSD